MQTGTLLALGVTETPIVTNEMTSQQGQLWNHKNLLTGSIAGRVVKVLTDCADLGKFRLLLD